MVGARRRGGMLRLEVWDTGRGVDPTQIPEILQPFGQAQAGVDALLDSLGF